MAALLTSRIMLNSKKSDLLGLFECVEIYFFLNPLSIHNNNLLTSLMYGNLCLFNCDVMHLINSPQLVKHCLKNIPIRLGGLDKLVLKFLEIDIKFK